MQDITFVASLLPIEITTKHLMSKTKTRKGKREKMKEQGTLREVGTQTKFIGNY